jgi:tetratricopeptide (TPR) repeat protein
MLPDFMTLWDFDDPAGTEVKFREVLPQAIASGDVSYQAQLLTQLARTYSLRRTYDEAHHLLDQADTLIVANTGKGVDMTLARIRSLLERGRTLNWQDEKVQARALFEEAYDLARASGQERLAIDAAHMVAIVADVDGQIEWALKGLEAARAASDPKARGWEGPLLNNLAWTYHDSGRLDEALATFKQSWDWRREHGPPKAEYIAKWAVARCLRSLERVEEALRMQREMLEHNVTSNSDDGYVYEELGECLLALGRADEARPNFARAYELLVNDAHLPHTHPERLVRMKELGGV